MMTAQQIGSNPFALMMDPDAIFAAMASSDRLARLSSRIWRPLDNPMIARADGDAAALDQSLEPCSSKTNSRFDAPRRST